MMTNPTYKNIIDDMVQQQNQEKKEEKIENTRNRNMRMAGIINDYLLHECGCEIIITGGLSVEFYTDGQYTTQDIDIITVAEKELNQILFKFEISQNRKILGTRTIGIDLRISC